MRKAIAAAVLTILVWVAIVLGIQMACEVPGEGNPHVGVAPVFAEVREYPCERLRPLSLGVCGMGE